MMEEISDVVKFKKADEGEMQKRHFIFVNFYEVNEHEISKLLIRLFTKNTFSENVFKEEAGFGNYYIRKSNTEGFDLLEIFTSKFKNEVMYLGTKDKLESLKIEDIFYWIK